MRKPGQDGNSEADTVGAAAAQGTGIAALLVLAALFALAWFRQPLTGYATTGASYGARVGCSCRFVQGRDISACRADLESGMGMIVLSADDDAKSVTARFPMFARQTAFYRPGQGCVLEKWEN